MCVMFKLTNRAKLEFILEMIGDIESYQQQLLTIEAMITNKMCFNTLLMNILQIGEALSKVDKALLKKYNLTQDADGKDDIAAFYDYGNSNTRIHVWLSK